MHERRRRRTGQKRSDRQRMRFVMQDAKTSRIIETHTAEIPNIDIPIIIPGFMMRAPTIISGASHPDGIVNGQFAAIMETTQLRKFTPKRNDGFHAFRFDTVLFFRMLAKIAHGYAAAQLGLCNFTPLLLDLILGRSKSYNAFIGGPGRLLIPDTRGMHRLRLSIAKSSDGISYHVVNVRLFSPFGTPEYDVIVAKCRQQ